MEKSAYQKHVDELIANNTPLSLLPRTFEQAYEMSANQWGMNAIIDEGGRFFLCHIHGRDKRLFIDGGREVRSTDRIYWIGLLG